MAVQGMTTYRQAHGRWWCIKCQRYIEAGDFYYHTVYAGLLIRSHCVDCPPEGAERAREAYRKKDLRAGARRAGGKQR